MGWLNKSSERIRKRDQEETQACQRSISSIPDLKYSEQPSDVTKFQSPRL